MSSTIHTARRTVILPAAGLLTILCLLVSHTLLAGTVSHVLDTAQHLRLLDSLWESVPIQVLSFAAGLMLVYPGVARHRVRATLCPVYREPAGAVHVYGNNPVAAYALEADKEWFAAADGVGGVAYRRCAGVALAAGDPIAPRDRRVTVAAQFADYSRRLGLIPAFYQVLQHDVDAYRATGLRAVKIGEEAMIDLPSFTLRGKAIANVRHCVTHVEREGITAEIYPRGVADEETLDGLVSVSSAWIAERPGRGEMGFSMGSFSRQAMRSACVAIARDQEGKVCAFLTFRWLEDGRGVVLDLMRRTSTAPSGTIDFLVARALEHFRDTGVAYASLSLAPMANTLVEGRCPLVERIFALMYEKGTSVYRYRSLYTFKRKFAPRWESRYLLYPAGLWYLIRVLLAVMVVHMPNGLLYKPSPRALFGTLRSFIRHSLDWRSGLRPEALGHNLALLTYGTLLFSLPEWRNALELPGRHGLTAGYIVLASAIAASDTIGGLALAGRRQLGCVLVALGAFLSLIMMAWGFAAGYETGWVSWTVETALAPVEAWIIWFLLQPEVRAYVRRPVRPAAAERVPGAAAKPIALAKTEQSAAG